jgi:hypothetical protein
MKNLMAQLRLTSLLSLILLACTAAYGQITPLGDTYTNSADPTTNYGAQKTLDVDAAKEITYIQFNLSSIPTGASISQATLKLYVNTVSTAGAFEVYAVNGAWTESALTYSLAPALGSVIDSNVPITTADKNQYILIPMTSTVQEWVNTPSSNNGLALVAVGSFNATFDSKETTTTSHPPELDVVFAGDGTITGVTTASGSGLTGGGTSGTLNLSLTNGCAANQVLQWNGTSWICAAVGTGTVTSVGSGAGLTGGPITGSGTLSLASNACASGNALSALPFTCSPFATLAANTFSANQTINGTLTANSSGGSIVGNTSSATSYAVNGSSTATTGDYGGIWGATQSTAGFGVVGESPFVGVIGVGTSGAGVLGETTATSGITYGVLGSAQSPGGYGVYGEQDATTGTTAAVYGQTYSTFGFGVEGASPDVGVYGVSGAGSAVGSGDGYVGVWGDTGAQDYVGVLGTADNGYAGSFFNNSLDDATLIVDNKTTSVGGELFVAFMPFLTGDANAIIGDPGCGNPLAIWPSSSDKSACRAVATTRC